MQVCSVELQALCRLNAIQSYAPVSDVKGELRDEKMP